MDSSCNNIVFFLNMRNRGSNVVLDTCIRYDKHNIRNIREALIDVLEFVEISSSYFSIFMFYYIKEKAIRKDIY